MADPFSTHQQMLVRYLLRSTGPILELGCGGYSTPIIHEFAVEQRRKATTVDTDLWWIKQFESLQSPMHDIRHIVEWDDWIVEGPYGIAFIDHAPAERREIDIRRLIGVADYFVMHDSEEPAYGYRHIINQVEHLETDSSIVPWTTAARSFHQ